MVDTARRNLFRGRFKKPEAAIRLPWTIDEDTFIEHCNQCGDCISACNENIIELSDGDYPVINFAKGECTFCTDCVTSCKQPLFVNHQEEEPWQITPDINSKCLALNTIFCQSCRDVCDQHAIKFRYVDSAIPKPEIIEDECNGCGACVSVCPQQSISLSLNHAEEVL